MKRSILTMVAAVVAFFAITASASAHVVTKAEVGCTGVTVSWVGFPGGSFDMNLAFDDSFNGGTEHVKSPYVVAHLWGASGTKFIPAPALNGVTFRKLLGTWTVDHGGSFTASAAVKPCNCQPPTGTVTTPGQTVTTPGQTVTTPGQTVTTPGVTTPGATSVSTTTVTTPAVTVTTPAVTVTTPAATRTIFKTKIKFKTRIKIRYRRSPVKVICEKGENGSYALPIGHPGKPIVTKCSRGKQGVKGAGVAG